MDGLLHALIKCVRRRLRDDEEITVEAVTKELGYTRQYVSGRFHRITGRLLSHFLKEKRLGKAARLLKAGNLRVSQIARRCGFDSENYFRQQFRERFGMSPGSSGPTESCGCSGASRRCRLKPNQTPRRSTA